MTDDVCGSTATATGEPCQRPAGWGRDTDSGHCQTHHEDGEEPGGRPTKFDDEAEAAILEAAREGSSQAGCARAAGVDESTLREWLDQHDEFSRAFAQARAEGEQRLIRDGLAGEANPSMAKFLLASSFDYQKSEKQEIEHSGEADLADVTVTFE